MTLLRRIFSGVLLTAVAGAGLFYGNELVFSILVFCFTVAALTEFFNLLKQKGIPVYRFFGVAMGALIPVIVYMEFGHTQSGEVLFLVLGCFFLFVLQFFNRPNPDAMIGIAMTLFGILYISWFGSYLIRIRYLPYGVTWVAFLLTVTKAADIGAYAIGSLFGRHALMAHISPKKTIEGTLAGILTSVLVAMLWHPYLPASLTKKNLVLVGLIIAVVGQVGDLSESLIKRYCEAKDSGKLLPGMGGVMDVVDSILFSAPIFYFHLKLITE